MICANINRRARDVALRKESVDRNNDDFSVDTGEMVALRKESVDRNATCCAVVAL